MDVILNIRKKYNIYSPVTKWNNIHSVFLDWNKIFDKKIYMYSKLNVF